MIKNCKRANARQNEKNIKKIEMKMKRDIKKWN